jgi:hypothetical protein
VSAVIVTLFFTAMYSSVFDNYSGGRLESLGWESETMNVLFWPIIPKLLLGLAILYLIVVFPISWLSRKKLNAKRLVSVGLFVLTGVLIAGIGLISVEPLIATDYFEYGERQELNKALEAIGYGYTNAMVYACSIFVSVSAWVITQLQFKSKED